MIAVRSNYLGGISAGKWHLVANREDHVALCGREHTSVGMFSCSVAPEHTSYVLDNGHGCKRCIAKASR